MGRIRKTLVVILVLAALLVPLLQVGGAHAAQRTCLSPVIPICQVTSQAGQGTWSYQINNPLRLGTWYVYAYDAFGNFYDLASSAAGSPLSGGGGWIYPAPLTWQIELDGPFVSRGRLTVTNT